jgi:hypothetical protein
MTSWNPQRVRLRQQLAGIAGTPANLHERAAAILQAVSRVLPSDAGWLAVRDPEARRHTPLATSGPAEPLRRNFQRPDADDEVEQLGLNRHRPPMLAGEIPYPLAESPSWGQYLLPAGFRGGLAAGLFTPGGRHIGFLCLLTGDPARPGPADRDMIATVTQVIAHGLDRTREIAEIARIVEAATAGVVLTRGGDVLPLPGLPGDRVLAPGSRVVATAAAELTTSAGYVTFLAPTTGPDDGNSGLVRVTALDCARPDLDHLASAVLLLPPGDLHGLTALHLRLLGVLAERWTTVPEIAVALGVDERTVAEALREALSALETTDLTTATVRAVRTGLRIPPQLAPPT